MCFLGGDYANRIWPFTKLPLNCPSWCYTKLVGVQHTINKCTFVHWNAMMKRKSPLLMSTVYFVYLQVPVKLVGHITVLEEELLLQCWSALGWPVSLAKNRSSIHTEAWRTREKWTGLGKRNECANLSQKGAIALHCSKVNTKQKSVTLELMCDTVNGEGLCILRYKLGALTILFRAYWNMVEL